MARSPGVSADELFAIAVYLANPQNKTEIHAELPIRQKNKFDTEYAAATNGYSLPTKTTQRPYYIWPAGTNKHGRQLRIYFARVSPEPPLIYDIYTDYGKWYGREEGYRINNSNLVMQLFECGFVLGMNDQQGARITKFMKQRFPVRP